MSELLPVLKQRFFDANGDPLAGGKLYSYDATTNTRLATYTDYGGLTANANPTILDANGEADIWINSGNYKFVLKDADDVVQWTINNVRGFSGQISQAVADVVVAEGGLAAANNLSDLVTVATALFNLGIAPLSYQSSHAVTSGQAATGLVGQTFDGLNYLAVVFEYIVYQSTTVFATGTFSIHYRNSTWELVMGHTREHASSTQNGITFSITQATTIATLKVAESGVGNGTILLKKSYYFA